MRLSENEQKVLACVTLEARMSVAKLSKVTGLSDHAVRHSLKKLIDSGSIWQFVAINVHALGYTDFGIYVSRAAESKQSAESFISKLVQSSCVPWVVELGGVYQYGFSLIFKHITEVDTFLSEIIPKGENKIRELTIVPRIEWKWYPPKFWWSGCHNSELTCGGKVPKVETDELDHAILRSVSLPQCATMSALARHLGQAVSTIEYRVRRLETTGVISGYAYSLDLPSLDLRRYVFLIQEKSYNPTFRRKIFQFCREHPHVPSLIHCVGSWNFELSFDLPRDKKLSEVRQELFDEVGIEDERITMLEYFKTIKLSPYPPVLGS